ncbi:hypothetical protein ACFVW2_31100 [Streptomyces sp. NPDC058171]
MALDERAEGWQRDDTMVFICQQCRPEAGQQWVRETRRRLYGSVAKDTLTVTVSGCVRTCPEDGVAVVLAGPHGRCRQWSVPPNASDAVRILRGHLSPRPTATARAHRGGER